MINKDNSIRLDNKKIILRFKVNLILIKCNKNLINMVNKFTLGNTGITLYLVANKVQIRIDQNFNKEKINSLKVNRDAFNQASL